MGLPGSGKSTLAKALTDELFPDCLWLNADAVREKHNDWDFSYDGRLRQAYRMRKMADEAEHKFVIADFIAPMPTMRQIYDADFTIWMDTIDKSVYEDTNKLFVPPENADFHITEKYAEKWSNIIYNILI